MHRLLGSRPDTRHFRHNAHNPLPLDLLVLDEASMLDLEMMASVFAALPPQAGLILLGDKDQLASVEAGAVLGDLCARADAGHYNAGTAAWLRRPASPARLLRARRCCDAERQRARPGRGQAAGEPPVQRDQRHRQAGRGGQCRRCRRGAAEPSRVGHADLARQAAQFDRRRSRRCGAWWSTARRRASRARGKAAPNGGKAVPPPAGLSALPDAG